MLRAHSVADVRASEATAMAQLPGGVLMQRAAHGLANAVLSLLGGGYGRRVLLLIGSGDNGGDALWAGALLAGRGARVEALLLADTAHAEGLAALARAGGFVTSEIRDLHSDPDVLLDGIVGIGGVPSGVAVDTGEVDGPHVTADLTVTFGTHKVAHFLDPAARACGALHLVDIGLDLPQPALEALQPDDVRRLLPRPAPDAHKYTRGVVGVRAGSSTYPGAALLAVAGANTGLAGMVRFVGSPAVADVVRQAHPEVVGAGQVQAWVVGPGAAGDAATMLAQARADGVGLVVDADALAHVVGPMPGCVLTPHAGELAAMLGRSRAEVEARPLALVGQAASRFGCTVLLKGRHTLVAEAGRPTRVNTTGVQWLASAGAGDVLAGLIGALLASGLPAYEAASVGCWLHGAAASLASRGGPLTATAVAGQIPELVRELLTSGG